MHQEMKDLEVVPIPDEYDPIDAMKELEAHILTYKPWVMNQTRAAHTLGELLDRLRFAKECYDREHTEMLDQLPSKSWKTYTKPKMHTTDLLGEHGDTIVELKYEIVDKFHFLLLEAIAVGMDWDEMMKIFYTKNQENLARQDRGY